MFFFYNHSCMLHVTDIAIGAQFGFQQCGRFGLYEMTVFNKVAFDALMWR